jgi:hypothetical protein
MVFGTKTKQTKTIPSSPKILDENFKTQKKKKMGKNTNLKNEKIPPKN